MGFRELPPASELRRHLSYDPDTGHLTRLITTTRKAGSRAGTQKVGRKDKPYFAVGVCSAYFFVHRVAWKIMTGEEPPENIDHINGDTLDNRWRNLRAATHGENQFNQRIPKNNTSGIKGVFWENGRAGSKNWRVVVTAYGQVHRLGRFYSKEAAAEAASAKRAELHGAFARHI